MPTEKQPISQNSIRESYIDIKVSLSLLKENWKAFVSTEIFALAAFIFFIIGISLVLFINRLFIPTDFPRPTAPNFLVIRAPFYILIFSVLIFYTFISSTYGLSHDIIISGDQFTEFENSFTYFKRHFVAYFLLSLLILWIPMAIEIDFHFRNFIEVTNDIFASGNNFDLIIDAFTLYSAQYLLFVLLNLTLPSITDKGSLVKAFKQNFNILIHNPKRIIASWGIYFIIFSLPSFILIIITFTIIRFIFSDLFFIIGILSLILVLSSVIIGYPIMSLIATRIYATTSEKGH